MTSVHERPRTAYRICPLCEAACGLAVQVSGDTVTAVRGDPDDVFSRGYLCPKGVALKDLHEDPDRLRTPMLRRGRGADARWEACDWDTAFAEIERRLLPLLDVHGRQTLAFSLGNPIVHKLGLQLYVPRLIRAARTPNVFSASTLDQMPKHLACGLMYGHWLSIPVPDIERSDLLIAIGANPIASNGSLWTVPDFRSKARALRARGGRLIVIDPRRSETAAVADEHVSIRPGGDVFLLLGMLQHLFATGAPALGPAEGLVVGLDALREAVAAFPPERVAAAAGIDTAMIRRLAEALRDAPRAALYGRIGTCTQPYGTLCSWLIETLNLITGRVDAEGGVRWPQAPAFQANSTGAAGRGRGVVYGRRRSRVAGAPEVMGEYPMGCLAEEIDTPDSADGPRVRALITIASNPVLSAPNGPRLAAALDTLDFMLSVDLYLNETTRHADVILPGLSPLEEPHYDSLFSQLAWTHAARFSDAALPTPEGAWPEWRALTRLTALLEGHDADAAANVEARDEDALRDELSGVLRASGVSDERIPAQVQALLTAAAPLQGPERQLDLGLRAGPWGDGFGAKPDGLSLARLRAAPHGLDFGPLRSRLPDVLRTPDGMIHAAPAPFLGDLARIEAALSSPAPTISGEGYPLMAIGRRDVRSNNSWMHNLHTLAKGPERCLALIHPQDAAAAGVADGDLARLLGAGDRSVTVRVKCSEDMRPGVLSLPHGWGHDLPGTRQHLAAERPGANLNALLDEGERDPLSGTSVLSGAPVRLQRISSPMA
ncbi:MAG: molybdopterin oxidoreductase family protein [Lysobacteraceae bacterium]|nr:MAG: molybdopterin oxidoreductase family protein [Xanthomonadaceae bacterium]